MKLENIEHLTMAGDIHGNWMTLCSELQRKKITSGVVVILGDCGIGTEKDPFWKDLSSHLSHRLPGITFLCLRGNHDNPERFMDTPQKLDYPNLKTLVDYEILEVNGVRYLPIGGAVSLDREWRQKENRKYSFFGSHRRIWWEGEKVNTDFICPDLRIHAIISHTAPVSIGPVSVRDEYVSSEELWFDICEERDFLQEVLVDLGPRFWYFGHFHESMSGTTGTTQWKGFGINEVQQIF